MNYTYLEKLILLSLKDKAWSEAADGAKNFNVPVQKLWNIIEQAYRWDKIYSVAGDEIVIEELLEPAASTPTDMRAALRILRMEELIVGTGSGDYTITAQGLRACREFRLNEV